MLVEAFFYQVSLKQILSNFSIKSGGKIDTLNSGEYGHSKERAL